MTISETTSTFLDDFGVSVTYGATTCTGILDMPDSVLGGGIAISTEYELTVRTADIAGANADDAITVNSVSYKVREYRKIDDGVFAKILLRSP